ncbi:hypothetical protein KEJ36_01815 [Candidatus Bathyarchaeota archaeon]|nr:hypothetical protein [Candidatus Bathyarchaeota archaeon]
MAKFLGFSSHITPHGYISEEMLRSSSKMFLVGFPYSLGRAGGVGLA